MLDKIRQLPHRTSFIIGLILILTGTTIPFNIFTRIIGCIAIFIGVIFVLAASDKKHSNTNEF